MRTLRFVALLLASLSSFDAHAVDSAPVNPVMAQARKSYAAGDYLSAIRLLERGLASGRGLEAGAREEARLYLSAAYFATGDRDAAQRALVALFTDVPDTKVPSELFPPPFMALVDRARAEAVALAKPVVLPDVPKAPSVLVPPPKVDAGPPVVAASSAVSPTKAPWWPVGLGAAAVAGGTACLLVARANHFRLVTAPVNSSDVISTATGERLAAAGSATQIAGWSLVGAGAAAIVSGVIWFLLTVGGAP